jgi:hypothetical protein
VDNLTWFVNDPVVIAPGADPERRSRSWIAALLGEGELLIDTAVALALIAGGTICSAWSCTTSCVASVTSRSSARCSSC